MSTSAGAGRRTTSASRIAGEAEHESDGENAAPPIQWYHINPNSRLVSLWDSICVLALCFTAIMTPFEVAFLPAPRSALEPLFLINRLIDGIFVLDMVSNFFRMRVSEETGDWETRLSRLSASYVSGWFGIDLLGVASSLFDIIPLATGATLATGSDGAKSPMTSLRIVRALRLIKLIRLLGASRQVKNIEVRIGTPRATVTVCSAFVEIFLWSHFCACILGLMTIFSPSPLDTWLATHGYCTVDSAGDYLTYYADQDEAAGGADAMSVEAPGQLEQLPLIVCVDVMTIYLECVWWGGGMLLGAPVTTMPEQGPFERYFSDATNQNSKLRPLEQIVVLIMKTFVALLWTTVIARFVGVYNTLDPDSRDFRTGWDALNRYISFFRIDTKAAISLRTFYLERSEIVRQKSRARVVADFSPLLLEDYMWRYNKKWLARAPCFSLIFEQLKGDVLEDTARLRSSQNFLVKIAMSMQPEVFVPKERPPPRRMYIIVRGTARFQGDVLHAGDTWGAHDVFLTAMPDARRARARATSHLHVLSFDSSLVESLKEECVFANPRHCHSLVRSRPISSDLVRSRPRDSLCICSPPIVVHSCRDVDCAFQCAFSLCRAAHFCTSNGISAGSARHICSPSSGLACTRRAPT